MLGLGLGLGPGRFFLEPLGHIYLINSLNISKHISIIYVIDLSIKNEM